MTYFRQLVEIPYYIDGGYMIFGLDNPDNFTIEDYNNDSVPELIITIVGQNDSVKDDRFLDKKVAITFLRKGDIPIKNNYYTIEELIATSRLN